jgi:hypothetical protein
VVAGRRSNLFHSLTLCPQLLQLQPQPNSSINSPKFTFLSLCTQSQFSFSIPNQPPSKNTRHIRKISRPRNHPHPADILSHPQKLPTFSLTTRYLSTLPLLHFLHFALTSLTQLPSQSKQSNPIQPNESAHLTSSHSLSHSLTHSQNLQNGRCSRLIRLSRPVLGYARFPARFCRHEPARRAN